MYQLRETTFVCKFIYKISPVTLISLSSYTKPFRTSELITLPHVVTDICDADGSGVCPRYGLDFNISSP